MNNRGSKKEEILVLLEYQSASEDEKEAYYNEMTVSGSVVVSRASVFWAVVAVVLVQTIFSIWNVVGALLMNSGSKVHVSPVVFTCCRQFVSCLLSFIFALLRDGFVKPDLRLDGMRIFGCGFSGVCVSQLAFITGLSISGVVGPLLSAIYSGPLLPVLASIISIGVGVEQLPKSFRLKLLKSTSYIFAITGALIVILITPDSKASSSVLSNQGVDLLLSNLCFLTEGASFVAFYILQKPLVDKYPFSSVSAWCYLVGCLALLSITLITRPEEFLSFWRDYLFNPDHRTILYELLFSAIFPSFVSGNLGAWANMYLTPTQLTLFSCLQPPITAILSYFFLVIPFLPLQGLGTFIVIIGLYLHRLVDNEALQRVKHHSSDPQMH